MNSYKQKLQNTSNILIKILKITLQYKNYIFIILLILNAIISFLPYISILLSQKLINLIQLKHDDITVLIKIGSIYVLIKVFNSLLVNVNSFVNQYYSEYLFLMLNRNFSTLGITIL